MGQQSTKMKTEYYSIVVFFFVVSQTVLSLHKWGLLSMKDPLL